MWWNIWISSTGTQLCHSERAMYFAHAHCRSKNICRMRASEDTLGRPLTTTGGSCFNVSLYVRVKYTCVKGIFWITCRNCSCLAWHSVKTQVLVQGTLLHRITGNTFLYITPQTVFHRLLASIRKCSVHTTVWGHLCRSTADQDTNKQMDRETASPRPAWMTAHGPVRRFCAEVMKVNTERVLVDIRCSMHE